jgi:hypothetical protein
MRYVLNLMKKYLLPLLVISLYGVTSCNQPSSSETGRKVSGFDSGSIALDQLKTYLVSVVGKMNLASEDFMVNAQAYQSAITRHGNNYNLAAKDPEVLALVAKMQENYKQMDSFGYETVEGIVAGVPSLGHYDVDLDAGNKAVDGPDNVAQIILKLSDGTVIDKEGNLNTHILEPALWGGEPKWVVPVDLNGDGRITGRESLPRAPLMVAASEKAYQIITELLKDSKAWNPTLEDCFGAMIMMTPTLSDYFEDWKESRYSKEQSGKFYAVSRVSDMRGIMRSCAEIYKVTHATVTSKDDTLARSIQAGFEDLDLFLNDLLAKEGAHQINVAEIDEYATQAKDKTDKLVPQIEQAAALLDIKPST